MSLKLKVLIIFGILVFDFVLAILIKKDKLPIKYAIVWLMASFMVLLVPIFPSFFIKIANKLGFKVLSSMLMVIFIGLLMLLTLFLTIVISDQNKKIIRLTQDIGLNDEKDRRR